ncbi:bifunctional riboflavin kinase/FAD synthetase [Chelatococcus sp. SYSU_G07232]|uniref:Riboflavin biosynthesis protein n=1 Tax=Chelatococcus albus TaxID=3047466 RepID=A0ABT7AFL3_9HYPH|nr:bifunctional riboflavin kinase/FAD synthetase [Chelatococcus sp. SYSU_G07232]MDJ1157885.1 bifunctional riboflavin kinase/FAD synthetase [Chelatococcus sp. SYSU_G07232]
MHMADQVPPAIRPTPFVLWRGAGTLPAALARPVVAIGNFDGLHRGHQAVVAATRSLAASRERPAAILTFEPHPRRFFGPDRPHFCLTPLPVKAAVAARLGLSGLIVLDFDAALAATDAGAFVDDLLVRRLDVSGIVVGHDFHFGKGREGSPAFLKERAAQHGIPVTVVAPVGDGDEPVSSTAVRRALERGDVAAAADLLGYRWFARADVRHGDKRGRTLGYPTANLRLPDDCTLRHGIYAVRIAVAGVVHDAVASFGRRPTFDNGAPLLEVHILDFVGDLYGQAVDVEFVGWIRGEERFASVEALVAQMDRDSAAARRLLADAAMRREPRSFIG